MPNQKLNREPFFTLNPTYKKNIETKRKRRDIFSKLGNNFKLDKVRRFFSLIQSIINSMKEKLKELKRYNKEIKKKPYERFLKKLVNEETIRGI